MVKTDCVTINAATTGTGELSSNPDNAAVVTNTTTDDSGHGTLKCKAISLILGAALTTDKSGEATDALSVSLSYVLNDEPCNKSALTNKKHLSGTSSDVRCWHTLWSGEKCASIAEHISSKDAND